jgi:hypothetical protein
MTKWSKKVYEWDPISIRLAEIPKIRCENDIIEDLRIMKINNWIKFVQDRVKWKQVPEKAKT